MVMQLSAVPDHVVSLGVPVPWGLVDVFSLHPFMQGVWCLLLFLLARFGN